MPKGIPVFRVTVEGVADYDVLKDIEQSSEKQSALEDLEEDIKEAVKCALASFQSRIDGLNLCVRMIE